MVEERLAVAIDEYLKSTILFVLTPNLLSCQGDNCRTAFYEQYCVGVTALLTVLPRIFHGTWSIGPFLGNLRVILHDFCGFGPGKCCLQTLTLVTVPITHSRSIFTFLFQSMIDTVCKIPVEKERTKNLSL